MNAIERALILDKERPLDFDDLSETGPQKAAGKHPDG